MIALDFETANGDPGSICAVGFARFDREGVVTVREFPVRPHRSCGWFSPFHMAIHHITPELVAGAPEWGDLWPRIAHWFSGEVVVAHNAAFDIGVLLRGLSLYELPVPDFRYFCTCKASRRFWPDLKNHQLDTVAAATGFRFRHHEAGADAEAAAVVTQEMLRQSGCADLDALAQRLGICPGSVSPEGHFPCRAIPKRRRRNEGS